MQSNVFFTKRLQVRPIDSNRIVTIDLAQRSSVRRFHSLEYRVHRFPLGAANSSIGCRAEIPVDVVSVDGQNLSTFPKCCLLVSHKVLILPEHHGRHNRAESESRSHASQALHGSVMRTLKLRGDTI